MAHIAASYIGFRIEARLYPVGDIFISTNPQTGADPLCM